MTPAEQWMLKAIARPLVAWLLAVAVAAFAVLVALWLPALVISWFNYTGRVHNADYFFDSVWPVWGMLAMIGATVAALPSLLLIQVIRYLAIPRPLADVGAVLLIAAGAMLLFLPMGGSSLVPMIGPVAAGSVVGGGLYWVLAGCPQAPYGRGS